MVGRKLDEYRKPRVAIGAFESSSALCRCIMELVAKNPAALALFVLAPGETERAELEKICVMRLSAPVRKRVIFIAAGMEGSNSQGRQKIAPGSTDKMLGPDTISDYAQWLDQRSVRHLQDVLVAGNHLLFVEISNASQEADAFDCLSRHCTGAVRLHDLPVQ